MKTLHLDNFQEEINYRILERGSEYYLEGRVTKEGSVGEWQFFSVEGSEPYEVRLRIDGNDVKEYECDCPYDMGPVCKHIAACLYSIKATKGKKRKSVAGKATPVNPHERRIISAIEAAKGRYGYIDWRSAEELGEDAMEMVEEARIALQNKDFMLCKDICIPVLVHLIKALENADDSNGDIGAPITEAFETLLTLANEETLDDPTRKDLMQFCTASFTSRTFGGWDWHLGMMEIASRLARDKAEADSVIDVLKETCPPPDPSNNDFHREFEYGRAMAIVLEIMLTHYPKDVTYSFMMEHLDIEKFRNTAISGAISDGNLDLARQLALDGISQDKEDKPGLVRHWRNYLLQIALKSHDKEAIIENAESLWLDGKFYHLDDGEVDFDFYSILKQTVGPEDWPGYIEVFAETLKAKSSWYNDSYADLCIREEWWPKLYEYVASQGEASYIKEYEKYLKADFRKQLIDLYGKCVYRKLERGTGRGLYQEICSYLRRMKKLGGREKVDAIISDLRQKYPRRPALLDELDNV